MLRGPKDKTKTAAIVAAAESLANGGQPITYRAIADMVGTDTVYGLNLIRSQVAYARDRGLFPWGVELSAPAPRDCGLPPDPIHPTDADLVGIEARKLAIRIGWRLREGAGDVELIEDGRAEVDEPPHGVPPRSGKDHAIEGRKVYANVSGSAREVRVHKAHGGERVGRDWR